MSDSVDSGKIPSSEHQDSHTEHAPVKEQKLNCFFADEQRKIKIDNLFKCKTYHNTNFFTPGSFVDMYGSPFLKMLK